jgi:hypothetical protein
MGADPIRARGARHAVMAAYYQIAGAAERSVSLTRCEAALAVMAPKTRTQGAKRQCKFNTMQTVQ